MNLGPKCDYQDCTQHAVQIERDDVGKRGHYCSLDCRDDERNRRRRERAAAKEGV